MRSRSDAFSKFAFENKAQLGVVLFVKEQKER
jgi:hypothetical protein